jgi:hypothetical protein
MNHQYNGNASSETLDESNWNYSWTEFYMAGGDDVVNT